MQSLMCHSVWLTLRRRRLQPDNSSTFCSTTLCLSFDFMYELIGKKELKRTRVCVYRTGWSVFDEKKLTWICPPVHLSWLMSVDCDWSLRGDSLTWCLIAQWKWVEGIRFRSLFSRTECVNDWQVDWSYEKSEPNRNEPKSGDDCSLPSIRVWDERRGRSRGKRREGEMGGVVVAATCWTRLVQTFMLMLNRVHALDSDPIVWDTIPNYTFSCQSILLFEQRPLSLSLTHLDTCSCVWVAILSDREKDHFLASRMTWIVGWRGTTKEDPAVKYWISAGDQTCVTVS